MMTAMTMAAQVQQGMPRSEIRPPVTGPSPPWQPPVAACPYLLKCVRSRRGSTDLRSRLTRSGAVQRAWRAPFPLP